MEKCGEIPVPEACSVQVYIFHAKKFILIITSYIFIVSAILQGGEYFPYYSINVYFYCLYCKVLTVEPGAISYKELSKVHGKVLRVSVLFPIKFFNFFIHYITVRPYVLHRPLET